MILFIEFLKNDVNREWLIFSLFLINDNVVMCFDVLIVFWKFLLFFFEKIFIKVGGIFRIILFFELMLKVFFFNLNFCKNFRYFDLFLFLICFIFFDLINLFKNFIKFLFILVFF